MDEQKFQPVPINIQKQDVLLEAVQVKSVDNSIDHKNNIQYSGNTDKDHHQNKTWVGHYLEKSLVGVGNAYNCNSKSVWCDFSAAFTTTIISLPVAITFGLSMNMQLAETSQIPISISMFTVIFGYIISILNGGNPLLKSFTATQMIMLIIIINDFGIKALPQCGIFIGLTILIMTGQKIHHLIRFTPNCILQAMKIGTGIMLIINQIPNVCEIKTLDEKKGFSFLAVLRIFLSDGRAVHINAYALSTFVMCAGCLSILLYRYPKVPWYVFFFVGSMLLGYVGHGNPDIQTLGSKWADKTTVEFVDHWKVFQDKLYHTLDNFTYYEIYTDPSFVLYILAFSITTLQEASVTIRIGHPYFEKKTKTKFEMGSLGIANFFAGVFGLLPMSQPIARNIVAFRSGASTILYLIVGTKLAFLMTYLVWSYLDYLPMMTVYVINASMGIILMDMPCLINYWRHSYKYGFLLTFLLLLSLALDLFLVMFVGIVVFFIMYAQSNSNKGFQIGNLGELKHDVLKFEASQRLQRYYSKNQQDTQEIRNGEFVTSFEPNCTNAQVDSEMSKASREALNNFEGRAVIYILQGKFNFFFYQNHLSNLACFEKEVIVLDLTYVLDYDIEYIGEYGKLVAKCLLESYVLYVTGFPKKRFMNDRMLSEERWIKELYESDKIIFKD